MFWPSNCAKLNETEQSNKASNALKCANPVVFKDQQETKNVTKHAVHSAMRTTFSLLTRNILALCSTT